MNEKIERAMQMQAAMFVLDRASALGVKPLEVYKEFRKSRTFEMLFDYDTDLWSTGPVYISEEYDSEN